MEEMGGGLILDGSRPPRSQEGLAGVKKQSEKVGGWKFTKTSRVRGFLRN